jgi:hypothetical protein
MFRASSLPSSGAATAVAVSGLPEAADAVIAPDDGRQDARNMLSCI